MSASTVIGDVTQTLEALLQNEQQPSGFFDVSLKSPGEETVVESMTPKVNLFLFRVAEDSHAKNQNWQPVGTGIVQKPPLALDLFYILTPFAEETIDEQRVLGEAMRIFYDHAIIEPSLLGGSLEHTTEELKLDLCEFNLEELTRVWNAVNKPYRLSVCYEVRIVFIDSLVEQPVRRVTEKEDQYLIATSKL